MISFVNNVYLVRGAVKSCIYNFNTKKLYHLGKDDTVFVSNILGKDIRSLIKCEDIKRYHTLLDEGILTDTDFLNEGEIKSEIRHRISLAWLEITRKCNLFCRHCYEFSDCKQTSEMTIDDYHLAIDRLVEYGVPNIQLIGGEPLIVGDKIYSMLDYAQSQFRKIEIFTNGTLIDADFIRYIKNTNICVALSVYSYNSSQHDSVTGVKGSHKKTMRTILRLKDSGIPYRVATVQMKGINIGDRNTELFTLNSRKDIVRISGRANLNLLDYDLLKKKLITKKRFREPLSEGLFNRLKSGHNCFSRRIYIDTDLNVFPCVMERRILHGSLREGSLKSIIDLDIISLGKNKIKECKYCEFRYTCHDCRSDSLTDDVYAKPWYCTYDPTEGEWADVDEFIKQLMDNYEDR